MLHVQNFLLNGCIVVVFYLSCCLYLVFNITSFYTTEGSPSFLAFPSRTLLDDRNSASLTIDFG